MKERKVEVENDGERERGCHVTNVYSVGLHVIRCKNVTTAFVCVLLIAPKRNSFLSKYLHYFDFLLWA